MADAIVHSLADTTAVAEAETAPTSATEFAEIQMHWDSTSDEEEGGEGEGGEGGEGGEDDEGSEEDEYEEGSDGNIKMKPKTGKGKKKKKSEEGKKLKIHALDGVSNELKAVMY